MKERLKQAFYHLKCKNLVKSQLDLAERLGYDKSTISQALNGSEKYLTDAFIHKFCRAFDVINEDWLKTGQGEMLKNIQNLENVSNTVAIGRDANGSEIHITSQKVDEFIRIMEKSQEHTDRMLTIIEKLINK
ncbi:MAG: helix-turn-helix domain-containing protein [Prevotellaceae bacterium]|jgi:transcriptional regulator with XRE-family HTH domain|nr:helix-turn-helix domain-containing protein [Prevotellaceae bacterium]